MLCGAGELQQQARPRPASREGERDERLICLSVAPSMSPTVARRRSPAGPRHRQAPKQHRWRQHNNEPSWPPTRRLRFRPIYLFGATVCLLLASSRQTPPAAPVQPLSGSQHAASSAQIFLAKAEATGDEDSSQQQQQQQHDQAGPLLVDTKYWIRDMEFGERDNWRAALKPCTLIERIAIQEEAAVISMGDSMDALGGAGIESNIRELILAPNGVLLMEEDTVSVGALDPLFVQYLNQSGDCFDSSLFANTHPDDGSKAHPLFHFEPHSDSMSWFNPDNWHSAHTELAQVAALTPHSHQIPCSEDVVVFGSRQFSFWPTLQGNERSKTLTFKLNFRPSQADESELATTNLSSTSSFPTLRVSKLEIDQRSYTQAEFDQLISIYHNQLFQFDDARSVFGRRVWPDGRQEALVIDDSSIHLNSQDMMELCHEEAGCLCGNEQPDVMRVICSFRQPLQPESMPCRDPIQVTGYCDKVCATNIAIVMDPDKFKESFLVNEIFKLEDDLPRGYFSDHIFIGQRRVDHNRYEVVLRLVPVSDDIYEQILGRELELAERIKKTLERSAIRSFYGIRSVSVRSSLDWRRDSRASIMWAMFAIASSLFILLFVYNDEMFSIKPLMGLLDLLGTRLGGSMHTSYSNDVGLSRADSFLGEPMILDQDGSVSELSMGDLQGASLASLSLDSRTIDSTHNLIEPEN